MTKDEKIGILIDRMHNSLPATDNLSSQGYVYVVRSKETGLYKIGMTLDLAGRLKQLSGLYLCTPILFSSVKTIAYTTLERRMHSAFSLYRYSGEWFRLTEELAHQAAITLHNYPFMLASELDGIIGKLRCDIEIISRSVRIVNDTLGQKAVKNPQTNPFWKFVQRDAVAYRYRMVELQKELCFLEGFQGEG